MNCASRRRALRAEPSAGPEWSERRLQSAEATSRRRPGLSNRFATTNRELSFVACNRRRQRPLRQHGGRRQEAGWWQQLSWVRLHVVTDALCSAKVLKIYFATQAL